MHPTRLTVASNFLEEMFRTLLFALNVALVLATYEYDTVMCNVNNTLLESPGDAVLTIFVEANTGAYCNETLEGGQEDAATALYVLSTLNKHDFVPGMTLGAKIYDTCQSEMSVYKQSLMASVEAECTESYDLGVLAPQRYLKILEPLSNYTVLPVSTYQYPMFTIQLIDVLVDFTTTKFKSVDIAMASTQELLSHFLDKSKAAGLCVRSTHAKSAHRKESATVAALIGTRSDIEKWIGETKSNVYLLLPIDGSNVNDLVAIDYYVISNEPFVSTTLESHGDSDFPGPLEHSVVHSARLLGIGKSIVGIAKALRNLEEVTGASCLALSAEECKQRRFVAPTAANDYSATAHSEVYDAMRITPNANSINYNVITRIAEQQGLAKIAGYQLQPSKLEVTHVLGSRDRVENLCVKEMRGHCKGCVNFQQAHTGHDRILKSSNLVVIYLTLSALGILVCIAMIVFILYNYHSGTLEGNPMFTLFLIVANILMTLTVIPFCMDDESIGGELLNSIKIFASTLSVGLVLSTVLSRTLFLAFSTDGVFSVHINGYLQTTLMIFIFGVQLAMSTMHLLESTSNPAQVVRSHTFVGLLSYDILLLVLLLVACSFIAQLQRNFSEGKWFFGSVIGLVVSWTFWLSLFALLSEDKRDLTVAFGLMVTAIHVIIGILIPRTYYMTNSFIGTKSIASRYESKDYFSSDMRLGNTVEKTRQPPFDFIHPLSSVTSLYRTRYPNYYGNPSPDPRCFEAVSQQRIPGNDNYGFRCEMREVENTYMVPRVRVENPEGRLSPVGMCESLGYSQPSGSRRGSARSYLEDSDCTEAGFYFEGEGTLTPRRRSGSDETYPSRPSSPKFDQIEETIREEVEPDLPPTLRVTRF